MSWDNYLKQFLTEKDGCTGMLAHTGIFSMQGAKCAAKGDEPTPDEIKEMAKIIIEEKRGTAAVIKGKKFQQIFISKDEKKAYFKVQGGGMIVALTNTLLIYGIFDTTKEGKVKGSQKKQNQGDAASLVETLADYLRNAGS